jgi:hypothetical protein
MAQEKIMELYTNSSWTRCYDNVYVAEALAWSNNGNHVTIYATGISADEAQTKLTGGLGELKLISQPRKRRRIREDILSNPHHLSQNREQNGATPRSDLDRLEQAVDRILAEVRTQA